MTGDRSGKTVAAPAPARATQAVFLERHSYRRRRLVDVARLLPLLGVALLLVPLMWMGADDPAVLSGEAEAVPMSKAILYIFAVWAALIVAAVLFGIGARRWGEDGRESAPRPD
jgi:hypothetical protein